MERISLSSRLNRRMLLFLCLVLVVFLGLFAQLRWQGLKGMVSSALEIIARDIQRVYVDLTLDSRAISRSSASDFLMNLYDEPYAVDILNMQNERVATTDGGYGLMASQVGNLASGHQRIWHGGRLYQIYVKELVNPYDVRIGRVVLTTDVTRQLKVLGLEVLWIFCGGLLFAGMVFGITTWFTRDTIRRIENLKGLSKAYSQRDFSREANVLPYDEIGQLGEMMNYMGKHWQDHHQKRIEGFSHMAHDFRTPLTVLLTWADYLHENPGEMDEGMAVIKGEAIKLKHMANRYLHQQSSDEQLIIALVDLGDFISGEMEKLGLGLERAGIAYAVEAARVDVALDAYRMAQVLFNLVDNGMRYGQCLFVKVCPEGDGAVLYVVNGEDFERAQEAIGLMQSGVNGGRDEATDGDEAGQALAAYPANFTMSVGMRSITHIVTLLKGGVTWTQFRTIPNTTVARVWLPTKKIKL